MSRGRTTLPALAGAAFLTLLPVAHLAAREVSGLFLTGADVLLFCLLLVFLVTSRGSEGMWGWDWPDSPSEHRVPPAPLTPVTLVGYGALALFGAWVLLGALWSHHPVYAVLKGIATIAMAGGALGVARSGLSRSGAADAWLTGTVLLLFLSAAGWMGPLLPGGAGWPGRLLYDGGAVSGLPFSRLRGAFLHPNMLGDYLLVSAALAWIRWPFLRGRFPVGSYLFAGALAVALLLTVSSAWLGAGLLLVGLASAGGRRSSRGSVRWRWRGPRLEIAALGCVVTLATAIGLSRPSRFGLGTGIVSTAGTRAEIWESSLAALRAAPFRGVGASPFLAETHEGLWDAHSLYLSVAGQFGPVGVVLLLGGVFLVVTGGRRTARTGSDREDVRWVIGTRCALAAVALHAVAVSSEDFRHLWAFLGLLALPGTEPAGAANRSGGCREPIP